LLRFPSGVGSRILSFSGSLLCLSRRILGGVLGRGACMRCGVLRGIYRFACRVLSFVHLVFFLLGTTTDSQGEKNDDDQISEHDVFSICIANDASGGVTEPMRGA